MEKLLKAVQKAKQKGGGEREEDYFYYPARDTVGNASAVIRFLPAESDDIDDFVKLYTHGFKGPTQKWFIDNCPTTLERDCPVCAANSELYAKLTKDEARKHGMNRKTSFIARILVIEDKKTPENEGKVFLFKFGTKIFDKIADAAVPEFENEKPMDAFSLTKGANFNLKIRKVDDQTNYDKSLFDATPSKCDVDVFKQYTEENNPLKFIAATQFKSEEDLQKRLDLVLGNSVRMATKAAPKAEEDAPQDERQEKPASTRTVSKTPPAEDSEDDIMALIKSLDD
jgi:hypothetical protein